MPPKQYPEREPFFEIPAGTGNFEPRSRFERLMGVAIENGYYNTSGGVGRELWVQPTPTTTEFMASLGLLLRVEDRGFSVFFNPENEGQLLSFLRRQVTECANGTGPRLGAHLSFQLSISDPFFVNFTKIPLDLDLAKYNFYFTNQKAHLEESVLFLNTGSRVDRSELLRRVPTQIKVAVPEGALEVLVLDAIDEVVSCRDVLGQSEVFLDFSKLPEDRYQILFQLEDGERIRLPPVLYSSRFPSPLGLVNLFFADPKLEDEGFYPVRELLDPDESQIVPTGYELHFEERSTCWIYEILPNSEPFAFENLRISSESYPNLSFSGPEKVQLSNGRTAFQFVSDEAIPLFETSPFDFQLWGRRSDSSAGDVLISKLPPASPTGVSPGPPPTNTIYVYV